MQRDQEHVLFQHNMPRPIEQSHGGRLQLRCRANTGCEISNTNDYRRGNGCRRGNGSPLSVWLCSQVTEYQVSASCLTRRLSPTYVVHVLLCTWCAHVMLFFIRTLLSWAILAWEKASCNGSVVIILNSLHSIVRMLCSVRTGLFCGTLFLVVSLC